MSAENNVNEIKVEASEDRMNEAMLSTNKDSGKKVLNDFGSPTSSSSI